MELYFPASMIEEARKEKEKYEKKYPNSSKNLVQITYQYTRWHNENVKYGFFDHLTQDNYAPTREERIKLQIDMFNCTTVIQPLYQRLEVYGMEPEIVQFLGFRNIQNKKDKEDPPEREHFALVVKIEKNGVIKEYLADPFHKICGEIVEKRQDYWKIKGCGTYKAVKRTFQSVLYYTKEEYAQMLYDMRYDGKSLDMLVAGQQVRKKHTVARINCSQMLYYADTPATLTTQLYIPQIGITDKAIHCAHLFDNDGNPQKRELTFSLTEDSTWHHLIGERRVAVTDYKTLQHVKRLFGKRTRFEKQPRVGQVLDAENMAAKKKTLLEIADTLYNQLSPEQQAALKPLVFARTLYEAEAQGQEYVFDEEKRDEKIKNLLQEDLGYRDKIRALDEITWHAYWNFSNTPKNEMRKAERMKKIVKEKRVTLKFGDLNTIRKHNKPMYHRNMDKVLFAQQYEHTSSEELARLVEERGLDWRVGYLAMVTDFFPYAFGAKKDLELDIFMDSLQRRVKARLAGFS